MSDRLRRSLLDGADLAAARSGAQRRDGPFAAAAAALLDGRLLQHDPHDPAWADRDRLLTGGPLAASAIEVDEPAERLTASVALGRAVAEGLQSSAGGGIYRVWCLLDPSAAEHGATWEAARDAAASGCADLAVICGSGLVADLLQLAGWRPLPVARDDVLDVLGAVDRAVGHRAGPCVIALR